MTNPPTNAPVLTDKPRSDYPLSGVKTGPAWRAAWDALRMAYTDPDEYVAGSVLAGYVRERVPDVSEDTIKNLLIAAYKCGVLVRTYRLLNSRNQAHYRISDDWLRELL